MVFIYFRVSKMSYKNVTLLCAHVRTETSLVEWRKRFNIKGDVFGCSDFAECTFLPSFWSCFKVDRYLIRVFFNTVRQTIHFNGQI